jgi:hypothetical protein
VFVHEQVAPRRRERAEGMLVPAASRARTARQGCAGAGSTGGGGALGATSCSIAAGGGEGGTAPVGSDTGDVGCGGAGGGGAGGVTGSGSGVVSVSEPLTGTRSSRGASLAAGAGGVAAGGSGGMPSAGAAAAGCSAGAGPWLSCFSAASVSRLWICASRLACPSSSLTRPSALAERARPFVPAEPRLPWRARARSPAPASPGRRSSEPPVSRASAAAPRSADHNRMPSRRTPSTCRSVRMLS